MNQQIEDISATSVVEIKKNKYIVDILKEIYDSGAITIAQLAKKLHTSVPSITVPFTSAFKAPEAGSEVLFFASSDSFELPNIGVGF